MKKFLPTILTIFLLVLSTILINSKDNLSIAKPSTVNSKKTKHYLTVLAKLDIKTLNGVHYHGEDLKKGLVLINFWASWCRPCLSEFPSLVALRKKFKNSEFKIIGINSDEEQARVKIAKITKKYHLNFDIYADKNGEITDKFMISSIPVTILFFNGKVVDVSNGSKDFEAEEFIEKLKELLK